MNVIFAEPAFPVNQREFVRGLKAVGANVIGIGERSPEALDSDLLGWMDHYEQIGSICDEAALARSVGNIQRRVPVHRLEATVEAHILPVAHVREACRIPGTSTKTAYLCRDKPAMKEVLRQGGVACAQSIGSSSPAEIRDFARKVGYPLILKPRDGAGASGTHRVDSDESLEEALSDLSVTLGNSVAVEEFIEGHEGFYDTLCVGGQVVHEFITHYYPNVLEAMRTRWISPQFISTNRVDTAGDYRAVKELGRKVISLLGVDTSPTHMEWFFGPKGLRFSEIGCRPPGVRAWDLHAAGSELDIYREWAMTIVHGRSEARPSRRFAAGLIALRPECDGTIAGYEGLEAIEREFGEWILDVHLPDTGSRTAPVEAGYMANAWIRMRHPDYDELRRMLDLVGTTVQVRAR